MRLRPTPLALLFLLCATSGCSRRVGEGGGRIEERFTFEQSTEGWRGGFADHPAGAEQDFQLAFERRPLPEELGQQGMAFYLSGNNHSDDLFMYLTRELTGLDPDTTYALTFALTLASNAGSGCGGIGGSPGESVYLKVGASTLEPQPLVDDSGQVRLNIDQGNQSNNGKNAEVIGNIANGLEQCHDTPYRLITRGNQGAPFRISTDARGVLWLVVGTDSGFEGSTALYYDTLSVVLEPQ